MSAALASLALWELKRSLKAYRGRLGQEESKRVIVTKVSFKSGVAQWRRENGGRRKLSPP